MAAGRLDAVDVTIAQLEASNATLARALLDLDARAGRILPDPAGSAGLTGRTAQYVTRVRDRLNWLWDRFTALSGVLSRAQELRSGGGWLAPRRVEELETLLHRASVPRRPPPPHSGDATPAPGDAAATGDTPGTGATGIAVYPQDLLEGTTETLAAANADLDALETARFGNLVELSAAERELNDLVQTAKQLGVGIDIEADGDGSGRPPTSPTTGLAADLAAARQAVAVVAAAMAADPMSVTPSDLAEATEAVRQAANATASLRRAHDSLADELRTAADLLGEIVAVATQAQESARTVVERVTGTDAGLMRLADGWFDDPARGLRPWLDRLTGLRAAGDWQRASLGLAAWLEVARSTLAAARQVAETNAAPLNRRSELRGLLRALHAKAVRNGQAEVPEVYSVFQRARESLYTAPTDLDAADNLVMSYAAMLVDASGAQGGIPHGGNPPGRNPQGSDAQGTDPEGTDRKERTT